MNTIKNFNIILISFLLIISVAGMVFFSSNGVKAQSSYSLYDAAVTHEYISVTIQGDYDGYSTYFNLENGDGIFFGKCIDMEVKSKVSATLYITVNKGRQLICRESDIQNMGVTEEYSFTLSGYQTKTFTVNAMCINMYEDAPVAGIYYDLGSVCSGDAYKAVSKISSSNSQDASGQCALWAVTDSADGDYLRNYGASDDDINSAQGILDAAGINYNIEAGSGGFPLIWIIIILLVIIIVVILIIVLIVMTKRKKRMLQAPSAPIAQPGLPVQTTPKFCTNCSSTLEPGDTFCPKCGHKL